ncbi:hypothetical protein SGUI_0733 [Serinicoccus hydrothermalis]|uniref:Uncharacterized protein n=1 Tax=Serinicoccus hydrothermalis TaxID=1758689 RepID=A0A1B1N9M8_9MICO|nr:hypothetical protein [Serinicoccus hydrothermalis]ANS78129.1 hypothetical protein SGUI_0733 [Serinicoccus hydrothermalis]
MDESQDNGSEYAEVVRLPVGRRPESRTTEIEGEEATVIYLPWRHEVDGETRPAGLYILRRDAAGGEEDVFVPDREVRGLEEAWHEIEQSIRAHPAGRRQESGDADDASPQDDR